MNSGENHPLASEKTQILKRREHPMDREEREDTTIYRVVVNHEEQYSIWPEYKENALGWKDAGKSGPKTECLAYIKEVWTDMRPLGLRQQLADVEARRGEIEAENAGRAQGPRDDLRDDLVKYLSQGNHPVEAAVRPEKTAAALKECIERGYVHIKFTDTRGGTELGMRLDREATELAGANFDNGEGTAHLVGTLTLNDVNVRAIADIDLKTLSGQGHLVVVS